MICIDEIYILFNIYWENRVVSLTQKENSKKLLQRSVLFILLIFLMSAFVPMAMAGDGDNEYTVVAKTISNSSLVGNNFKFENIPAGNYVILAGYTGTMGGKPTYYIAVQSIEIKDESISSVDLLGVRVKDDNKELTFLNELYDDLVLKTPTGSIGSYSIEGAMKAPKMNDDPINKEDVTLILIQSPIIGKISSTEENDFCSINVPAYGASSVKVKYNNNFGVLTENDSPEKTDDNYIFKINKSDLIVGTNSVTVTAISGGKEISETFEFYLVGTEYEVVAKTISNSSLVGNNFKFENIPAGNYVILAGYVSAMGDNIAVKSIEIKDESLSSVGLLGIRANKIELISTHELYADLISKTPTESTGSYSIEGVIQAPKMKADPENKEDVTLILLKAPVIAGISKKLEENQYTVNVVTIDAENVSIEYKNKSDVINTFKNETPIQSDQISAAKIFSFTVDINDLNDGFNDVSVIAYSADSNHMEEITLGKADPALLNAPRKVVLISGYETHNKIISNLSNNYSKNGSNVELVSIETKNLVGRDKTELREAIQGADVISIHMVSTTPTWDHIKDILMEECRDGTVVLLDDNSTRQSTSYGTYKIPEVPGISDTPDNTAKYKAKIANYWSNTPYKHVNLEYMINTILIDYYGRYDLDEPKDALELPIKGIYHPHLENLIESEYSDYITWYSSNDEKWDGEETAYQYDPKNPTVSIAFYKSYYPDKMEPIAKMIEELEKKGVNVIATYCEAPSYFDAEEYGGKYFIAGELDLILSFRYIGEHRFNQTELDVPIFNVLIVDTAEEWEELSNPFKNASMKLINPELIGAIDPIAVVSTESYDGVVQTKPMLEQMDWLVGRVVGQLNLQLKENADKNVAVIYYNHGGGKGNIGASYLDVPASTITLLEAMDKDDYNIDTSLIPDSKTMVDAMITQGINVGGWAPGELKKLIGDVDTTDQKEFYDTGKAILISKDLYEKWFKEIYLGEWFEESIKLLTDEEKEEKIEKQTKLYEEKKAEVTKMWGAAPGDIMVYQNKYIIIPYIDVSGNDGEGRVILMPQPSRGHEENIETLYHDANMPPTHQYIAFYLWLQKGGKSELFKTDDGDGVYPAEGDVKRFAADALIHLGRHGTQEWLPGKESALSRYDWPAVMTEYVPVVYPYIVDGVGEGIIAKRRGNAVLVDHMTPAIVYAGLYGDYGLLSNSIQSYETVENEDVKAGHAALIVQYLLSTGLNSRLNVTESELQNMNESEFDDMLHDLEEILEDLKTSYMPYGLHILGKELTGEPLNEMVYSMLGADYIRTVTAVKGASDEEAYALLELVLDGKDSEAAVTEVFQSKTNKPTDVQKGDIVSYLDTGKTYASNLRASADEIDGVLDALNGKYIRSKVGGDPVTRPQVLPTGGNFQTVDQRRVPTKVAWDLGVKLTNELLASYYEENGEFPNSVGYVLWAGETTRTEGVLEAQIMYLIGIKPIWAASGNVDATKFETISANDLVVTLANGETIKRPRIDVIVEISGAYRDQFPEKVLMLDRAIRLAYEQTDGDNHIRTNTDKIISSGYSKDEALSRIFGPQADSYGAGMDNLIGSTDSWKDRDQLAEHFINRMGFVYNSLGGWGNTNDKELYKSHLANVDATVHSRSSALYGAVDIDDFYQYLGGLNLAVSYSREDGQMPNSYVMNLQKVGDASVDSLKDFIEKETYARYLNQKWMDGMKLHGYAGAREVAKMFDNLWGWEALDPSLISDQMWTDLYNHLLTGENGDWLKSDPQYAPSYQSSLARLIQVATKDDGKYWNADSNTLNQLVSDYVKSVVESGVACCHHTCGNPTFDQFIAGQMSVAGVTKEDQETFLKILQDSTERLIPEDKQSGSSNGAGFGMASIAGAGTSDGEDQEPEGEQGGGYGTELGEIAGEVTGYEMKVSNAFGDSMSNLRDFINNPTFSASSITAIAMVVLVVGAVFFGSRKKI